MIAGAKYSMLLQPLTTFITAIWGGADQVG